MTRVRKVIVMKLNTVNCENLLNSADKQMSNKKSKQNGSAIVIALLIMVLLMGFVALAISRTNSETVSAANDAAESRSFEAAQASLEIMTRNFDKIFDFKLNPVQADLDNIKAQKPPDFTEYTFDQRIEKTKNTQQVVLTGGDYQGLRSTRDEWELKTTATDTTGVEVELRRRYFNDRIPIFQFGIFYEDDLEFHPGPRFDFGGRVHSNRNLFMMAGNELLFSSKVTTVGEVFTDVARNGNYTWADNVKIKNASGTNVRLYKNMGSVLKDTANGAPVFTDPDMPVVYRNTNWVSNQNQFEGNLLSAQKPLELPIRFNSSSNPTAPDYIELVKRGKNVGDMLNKDNIVTTANADTELLSKERYYNKPGMRVSLADSKAKLPGCVSTTPNVPVIGTCGVRLDGAAVPGDSGTVDPSATGDPRGYQPKAMADGYRSTELNGERFHLDISGRAMWIKIETVQYNTTTNIYETKDITEDILSLGITERAKTIAGATPFKVLNNYDNNFNYGDESGAEKDKVDNRSVIKLQRFIFGNAKVTPADTAFMSADVSDGTNIFNYIQPAERNLPTVPIPAPPITAVDNGEIDLDNNNTTAELKLKNYSAVNSTSTVKFTDHYKHWRKAEVKDLLKTRWVVPFPINMFDTREGLYNTAETYPANRVPWNGVMSLIDIDVKNLRRFLNGEYETVSTTKFPTGTKFANEKGRGLKSTDIPNDGGWVLYISDRRGDYDFDGEYDMEDIYGNNDGNMQTGEDVNNSGDLQADYRHESVRYKTKILGYESEPVVDTAIAAVVDHKFYRRGVRLINGEVLPGKYDIATPSNTKGFTVASENAVYVKGNYNATGISTVGNPTPSANYLPQNDEFHIPASIAADTVLVLSNNWSDGLNLSRPFAARVATETTYRFAMISGDARSRKLGTPNQGSGDACLAGGVHNFKRFLENWNGQRLNYTGSLINLYNARNNNGAHKSDGKVYDAPTRNWTFDTSFLDPDRLPPGTPFFQSIQLSGFERLN